MFLCSRFARDFTAIAIVAIGLIPAVPPCLAGNQEPGKPIQISDLKVTDAVAANAPDQGIAFGGVIEVTITSLDAYLAQNPEKRAADFVLFLDTRAIPGLAARRVAAAGENADKLRFDLQGRTDKGISIVGVWNAILGRPCGWPGYAIRLPVTVGFADQPFNSSASVDLIVISKAWGWVGLLVALAITILLAGLAWRSDLLRDAGPPAQLLVGDNNRRPARKPFSLARVQLAFWFWTIIVSYVFIWVMNCETGSLTGQVLGILAISTLTLVGSTAVDARNADRQQASLADAKNAIAEKEKQAAVIDSKLAIAAGPESAALAVEKSNLRTAAENLSAQVRTIEENAPGQKVAQSFLTDILSDDYGVSFHRFQAFAWSLVVIVTFLEHVWQSLTMPELNEYLLTLMGMSSATYVGLKTTEPKLVTQNPR